MWCFPARLYVYFSAGIGRTGTFIVLDMLTYEGEDRGSIDIFGCVATLRSQRCNMVQTPVSHYKNLVFYRSIELNLN